jgi:hypothetical protein
MASSSSPKLSRFDLPGYTLPLNFSPGHAYKKRYHDVASSAMKEVEVPASRKEQDLFPSALAPGATDSQYERLSHDYIKYLTFIRLPLTTLREFTMIQLMNHITDKPGWETKVQPAQNRRILCLPRTDVT